MAHKLRKKGKSERAPLHGNFLKIIDASEALTAEEKQVLKKLLDRPAAVTSKGITEVSLDHYSEEEMQETIQLLDKFWAEYKEK
jgi:hypothetical protein